MNAVPFDTLKMAQRLEAAGFAAPQAAGAAEALAEALTSADLATRGDMNGLRTVLKGDINGLRTELKGDIASLRAELKADIGSLRSELKGEMGSLRSDIELLRRDMTIRLGGMMVVGFGVLAVIIRLAPPHP
jgi:hypothetical protein